MSINKENILKAMAGIPIRYKIIGGAVLALLLLVGVSASVGGLVEWHSRSKLAKIKATAEADIAKMTLERDQARQDAATAQTKAAELQAQLDNVNVMAGQSETRLVAARKTTTEAKRNYETTNKVNSIVDDRPSDVKREELRARYAERGIIVTGN
jgi:hypothetical protein